MIEITSDDPLIEQIAWIHEQIPKSYDSCYVTTELEVKLRTESIRLLMKYNHDRIIVVEKAQLSAFIWFHIGEKTHVKSLYVHPDERGKGYAYRLKQYVERLSLSAGVNYIYGHVDPDNHAMRRLNHKLGYSADGKMMYKHIDIPDD